MNYIKSPLNYTGGKYKLLDKLFKIFPQKINTFIDLFTGGFNVGINVNANTIIANDNIHQLIDLYNYLATHTVENTLSEVHNRIKTLNLSKINKDGYYALRNHYNHSKHNIDLLVLIFYAFNHQIRFNRHQMFNIPFEKTKCTYNSTIENNLIKFCQALHNKNIQFSNKDFMDVNLSTLKNNDFVYCDPPYLIASSTYTEHNGNNKGWTEREEQQLLKRLNALNQQNVKFALSNMFYHKGLSNNLLIN